MSSPLFDGRTNQTANLCETIAHVAGAIVSKPLLNIGPLKQTLFAMDAGQSISEHRVPLVGTVHVLDGVLRFTVDGTAYELRPGHWLIMAPGAAHSLRAEKPVKFLLTLVRES
ncbi:MAG: cupin domain-containing protein [Planctomycetes bacterium]|nr:cupin domain-containing protein [Planctomycetota bacterium]